MWYTIPLINIGISNIINLVAQLSGCRQPYQPYTLFLSVSVDTMAIKIVRPWCDNEKEPL